MRSALRLAALAASLALSAPFARAEEPTTGIAFEGVNAPFGEIQAKAKAASKPIFIDFYTEWCGWCKKLDADVFVKPDVGEHMKAFVPVRYDAEKEEGKQLAEHYHVHGFPTLLVIDAEGAEIDRIVGYRAADAFIAEVDRIARGEGTLKALKADHDKAPEDLGLSAKYAAKLADADPAAATLLLTDIAAAAKGKDTGAMAHALDALARLLLDARRITEAQAVYERILQECGQEKLCATAVARLAGLRSQSDPQGALALIEKSRDVLARDPAAVGAASRVELRIHLALAGQALARQAEKAGDDPTALNEIAWAAFEHGIAIKPATEWARKAVELTHRKDGAVLDTLANLLFAQGKVREAIAIEKEAVPLAEGAMKHELAQALAKFEAAAAYRKAAGLSDGEEEGEEDESGEGDEDGEAVH